MSVRKLPFQSQVRVEVFYKTIQIGNHRLDLVIDDTVIVELKAIPALTDVHTVILLSYLAATRLRVGLLLNFGKPSLEYKRLIR